MIHEIIELPYDFPQDILPGTICTEHELCLLSKLTESCIITRECTPESVFETSIVV